MAMLTIPTTRPPLISMPYDEPRRYDLGAAALLSQDEGRSKIDRVFTQSAPISIPPARKNGSISVTAMPAIPEEDDTREGDRRLARGIVRSPSSFFLQRCAFDAERPREVAIASRQRSAVPFLDESCLPVPLFKRIGAYSYSELDTYLRQRLGNLSRQFPKSGHLSAFLAYNRNLLINELSRLSAEVEPLYFTFVEFVRSHLQMQRSQDNNEARQKIDERLSRLVQSLEEYLSIAQNSKCRFQPLATLCVKIANAMDQKNFEGLSFPDLDGHISSLPLGYDATEQECRLVRNFYYMYSDEFLENHVIYFSRFISAAYLLKAAIASDIV